MERTEIVTEWHGSNFINLQWHPLDNVNSSGIFLICHIYSGIDQINPSLYDTGTLLFPTVVILTFYLSYKLLELSHKFRSIKWIVHMFFFSFFCFC